MAGMAGAPAGPCRARSILPLLLLLCCLVSCVLAGGKAVAAKDEGSKDEGSKDKGKDKAPQLRGGKENKAQWGHPISGKTPSGIASLWSGLMGGRSRSEVAPSLGEKGTRLDKPPGAAPGGRSGGVVFDLSSWLAKGGHLDAPSGRDGDTPLITACREGNSDAACALISVRGTPSSLCPLLYFRALLASTGRRQEGGAAWFPLCSTSATPLPKADVEALCPYSTLALSPLLVVSGPREAGARDSDSGPPLAAPRLGGQVQCFGPDSAACVCGVHQERCGGRACGGATV